ncbi:Rho GTPase-activating protein 22 [Gracilariopsis chorda]|uniref:Rho GTPase-activating protein 22 n=1 Tax=Gracilariopsis chorda TaxID=448386 RepID=A0A2V3J7E4_9FLOR|nr:Rho GTPase-activating protein 22 [Gracilariopsis chorda]|eukprot:PXF49992.1 Rho GTPase-activating protein 22 [Gracilariopsis chorda]
MAAAGLHRHQDPPIGEPAIIHKEDMMAGMMGGGGTGIVDNGTSLIARAEALNAFMRMQPAANQARHAPHTFSAPPPQQHIPSPHYDPPEEPGCLCFGSSKQSSRRPPARHVPNHISSARPRREYYPDNLSVQPERHPWTPHMEWLILACIDFLELHGLDERTLFAVSAVDDLVRNMHVDIGVKLPSNTDPHVAAGVIKAQIRHANEPLVAKDCLKAYIASQPPDDGQSTAPAASTPSIYRDSHLARTVDATERMSSPRRAYILARFMRLLGRVSANVEVSKMNAHCLAKCVAPSMLHWDPNSSFALLMLGKITAFVMTMIEDARVFDEKLCQKIADLEAKSRA